MLHLVLVNAYIVTILLLSLMLKTKKRQPMYAWHYTIFHKMSKASNTTQAINKYV